MHCIARVTVLALVCLVQLANCDSSSSSSLWQKVETQQCVNDSLAVKIKYTRGDTECTVTAALNGLLVAQFNSDTRQCSVFHYQSVCQLIDAAASSANDTQHSCTVYARLPVNNVNEFMQISNKLSGAWVMSDDEDASKSNLVCGQTQQWHSESVKWTKEGAKFDGTSSKMTLENANFGNMSLGLTWLIRLKREQRGRQAYLENFDCDTMTNGAVLMTHYDNSILHFATSKQFTPPRTVTTASIMTSDPSQFINVGIVAIPVADKHTLFYNRHFVTDLSRSSSGFGVHGLEFQCFCIGCRVISKDLLFGTVRAVAVASSTITEVEINKFFSLVE